MAEPMKQDGEDSDSSEEKVDAFFADTEVEIQKAEVLEGRIGLNRAWIYRDILG